MEDKIEFYIYTSLLERLDQAGAEHGRDRSDIIRRALRRFERLVRQNKIPSLSDACACKAGLATDRGKERISFRCEGELDNAMKLVSDLDRPALLNKAIKLYLDIEDGKRHKWRRIAPFVPPPINYKVKPVED
ncbi:MAG: hypothetical protein A2020_16510 [Lentisphaerae bacterium GWF2_45_14]|nr:MAG: hypothetical protein A2020_16510 [Lentisphaerae bacterium GWF2_45_14]